MCLSASGMGQTDSHMLSAYHALHMQEFWRLAPAWTRDAAHAIMALCAQALRFALLAHSTAAGRRTLMRLQPCQPVD